jgi:hypothetical protein
LTCNIVPEGRLLFRALVYGLLAAVAFALPKAAGWWPGLFLAYMAFNLLVGKMVANFCDAIYRIVTRQPIDLKFIRWRESLELLSEIPPPDIEPTPAPAPGRRTIGGLLFSWLLSLIKGR